MRHNYSRTCKSQICNASSTVLAPTGYGIFRIISNGSFVGFLLSKFCNCFNFIECSLISVFNSLINSEFCLS